jgi:hypothetical protein
VEFKQVDWVAVTQRVAGGRVVLAIDVAKSDMVATLLTSEGAVRVTFTWVHPQQSGELLGVLEALAEQASLEVVLEPSGTYGDALVAQLQRRAIAVFRVSPKRVHDVAEVYDGVPSLHDAKAAELIGRLHLQGLSQCWVEVSAARRELQAQVAQLAIAKGQWQTALNRLEARLSRHWPELETVLDLGTATVSALVAAYGDPAAVAADPHGARSLMRRVGGRWLAEETIAAVLASAGSSLGAPPVAGERGLLQGLAETVQGARRHGQAIEREIRQQVSEHPAVAALAPIVGTTTAAVLVAVLGDPREYANGGSYLKAMGLNLKERSSGTHQGQLKITKRGPGVVRFYLYYAALRLIHREPVVAQWFRQRTDHPGVVKGRSVVALMRKLAQALWRVAQGDPFEVERLFKAGARAA